MSEYPNLLIDGDCEQSGVAGYWSAGSSKSTTNPHSGSQCLNVGAAPVYIDPSNFVQPVVLGWTYRLTGWARGDGSGAPLIRLVSAAGSLGTLWIGTTSTDWQPFDITFESHHATMVYLSCDGSTSAGFDDLDLTLDGRSVIVDGDTLEIDTAKWLSINGGVLSKETGTPYFGDRCLRVTDGIATYVSGYQQVGRHTTGRLYRCMCVARSNGAAAPRVVTTAWANKFLGTTSTDWQPFDFTYVSPSANGLYYITNLVGPGEYTEWGAIRIVDLTAAANYKKINNNIWRR